jgi:hypothetical protein
MRCGNQWHVTTAVLAVTLSTSFALGQSVTARPEPVPIGSRPISSAVIATWGSRYDDSDGPPRLEFLVLWRGAPGWLWPGPFGTTGSGEPARIGPDGRLEFSVVGQRISVGNITFELTVDVRGKVAHIRDQKISLRETNVILVDQVDSPEESRIVRTMWVDPNLQR